MGEDTKHAVEIAVLKTELNGIREQQKAHSQDTASRFEKLETKVDVKFEELFEILNKGKGAFSFALIVSGFVGAAMAKVFALVFPKIGG